MHFGWKDAHLFIYSFCWTFVVSGRKKKRTDVFQKISKMTWNQSKGLICLTYDFCGFHLLWTLWPLTSDPRRDSRRWGRTPGPASRAEERCRGPTRSRWTAKDCRRVTEHVQYECESIPLLNALFTQILLLQYSQVLYLLLHYIYLITWVTRCFQDEDNT